MIGVCPVNWQDDAIRRKCEDVSPILKEKEHLDLRDPLSFTPVVGTGNVTFRNAFCAICHSLNIMTLQPWEMEINCPESTFEKLKKDISSGLENLGPNCAVRLKPPERVNHLARLPCFPLRTIAKCKSDTGTSPDVKVVKECETYLAPICASDGVVYKNSRCAHCDYTNEYPSERRVFYCLEENRPTMSLKAVDPFTREIDIGRTVPLSVVFDFSSKSGVRFETENFVFEEKTLLCNRGQVFDPFQGSCITFVCTEGYKFTDGECTPTYTGNLCIKSNSTPDGIVTVSFNLSLQNTLNMVNQYAQLCIVDFLAIPINSLYSRKNLSASLLINSSCLMLQSHNTVDIEFMIDFNSTNVHILLENLIRFQSFHQPTSFLSSEMLDDESIAMKQVCDAISRIQFEYGCKKIKELECPTRWTRESKWSLNATNGMSLVFVPRSQHSIALTDTNLNVDISFNGRSITNFSSALIYCRSLECPSVTLNSSLFDIVSRNGKSYLQGVSLQNFTVPEHSFELLKEGLVKICSSVFSQNGTYFDEQREGFFQYSQLQTYLSTIGLCLSVVCL
ncbi:hypothetical protein HOLleu_04958 [Holothuria leucospilota]|uniref:Uncharacterized protein n=1 Tax=Holothuria leucospilota TaxID=206669 RepID=A0A9Q1HIM5_HOLLE|nr:hypothetical protein HOLleu_04958 [Holothuria leucospilota]